MLYRQEIYDFLCQEMRRLSGEIECDARCFGWKRTGSYLLRCDCRLMNEIRDTAEQGSVFYTATFRSYTLLKFFGKQCTVNHNT